MNRFLELNIIKIIRAIKTQNYKMINFYIFEIENSNLYNYEYIYIQSLNSTS